MNLQLIDSIVRILKPNGKTAGTGFVIREDGLIATCAHVVKFAGAGPGSELSLVFLASKNQERRIAIVEDRLWRDPDKEDVAFLHLQGALPEKVVPLPLGSSMDAGEHTFSTFGFPAMEPVKGLWGNGIVLGHKDLVGSPLLQLRSQEVTEGFSGAPIWDTISHMVIGIVTESMKARQVKIEDQIIPVDPDPNRRFTYTSFATPVETLRAVNPEFQIAHECPYRKLVEFTEAEEDQRFFYGREAFVETLVQRLKDHPRFLAVFGPSGSGKTSVVRAGLISRLRGGALLDSEHWEIILKRPADDPFQLLPNTNPARPDNLTQKVETWATQSASPTARLVLIIDQFEELFISTGREPEIFITRLAELWARNPRISLILVMRDDFYSRFTGQKELREWLDASQGAVNIPPTLTHEELEAIICEPARRANIHIQDGLADLLIKDASGEREEEARSTVLPLLEFTLARLWEKRQNEWLLTLQTYTNMHGIKNEFTSWANATYNDLEATLTPEQRHLAPRVFTDLVHLGDEKSQQPNSRQPKPLTSLWREEGERQFIEMIVNRLISVRLLTTVMVGNEPMIEIIHDVLINQWGYLKSWIKANRSFLAWQQKLAEQAHDWAVTDEIHTARRDKGRLLGARDLSAAEEWRNEKKAELRPLELDFIKASRAKEGKKTARLYGAIAILVCLSLVMGLLFMWALVERNNANQQAQVALSHALAAQSESYLSKNPEDAFLLAVHAYQVNPNFDSRNALFRALAYSPHLAMVLRHDTHHTATGVPLISGLLYSPDGSTIISSDDGYGQISVWNMQTRKSYSLPIPQEGGNGGRIRNIVESADGKLFASVSPVGITLWNLRTRARIWQLNAVNTGASGPSVNSQAIAFSPDGKYLAVGDCAHFAAFSQKPVSGDVDYCDEGRISLWNLATKQLARPSWSDPTGIICGLAFSQDSSYLASKSCSGEDASSNLYEHLCGSGKVTLWAMAQAEPQGEVVPLDNLNSIAFSHHQALLAMGGKNGSIALWDVRAGKLLPQRFSGHQDAVCALAFAPNDSLLASGGNDKTVRLWDATTGNELEKPFLGHASTVSSLTFSPDGQHLASGDMNDAILLWDVSPFLMSIQPIKFNGGQIDSSPMGVSNFNARTNLIALALSSNTSSPASDTGILLWNVVSGKAVSSLAHTIAHSEYSALTISPDGRFLAAAYTVYSADFKPVNNGVEIWDLTTHTWLAQQLPYTNQQRLGIQSLSFSSDGCILAGAGYGDAANRQSTLDSVVFWNIPGKKMISQNVVTAQSDIAVAQVTFQPDSQIVAVSRNSHLEFWNATTGTRVDRNADLQLGLIPSALAFSHDGVSLIASSGDGKAVIVDANTQQLVGQPVILKDFFSTDWLGVNNIVFSQDNKMFITGTEYNNVIWDNETHDLFVENFRDSDNSLPSGGKFIALSMTSLDQLFLYDSMDQTIEHWNMNVSSWVKRACTIANRNFTSDEWHHFMPNETYQPVCPSLPVPKGEGRDLNR